MVMEQLLDDCNLIEFDCRDDELNDFIINDDAIPFYEKNGFVLIRSGSPGTDTSLMCYDLVAVSH